MRTDCVIIGGGIVGLSVGFSLLRKQPGLKLALLEKESEIAQHQSGRNSGVIHSGIYYRPGSYKARFARDGNASMVHFCRDHGIPHEICGKVIVATDENELAALDRLYRRGLENGIDVKELSAEGVREVEPHVRCLKGIQIPSTGIVSYSKVCAKLASLMEDLDGVIMTGAKVVSFQRAGNTKTLETSRGAVETRFVINCGGLQSDRIARKAGAKVEARIVPFRGEYYELVASKRDLVKGLIYPVPDPTFPFLGVHFTRMIDGGVHAGPNTVLAFSREGYRTWDIGVRDLYQTLTYPGFWKAARQHRKEGWKEIRRSLSKNAFVKNLQRLIPEVTESDLVKAPAGVRAQAMRRDGSLVDDFLIVRETDSIHVCNAPSPAATASLEIGRTVAEQVPELRTAVTHPATRQQAWTD